MKKIELRVEESQLAWFDAEAKRLGTSRAELMRECLSNRRRAPLGSLTPVDYYNVIEVVRKRIGNCIDKRHIETVVSVALAELQP
jgi:hypothetical protein|tara:strand:- start:277 stop:531 length:255 start_codon:yes stop_codon:yes gene_type:complete